MFWVKVLVINTFKCGWKVWLAAEFDFFLYFWYNIIYD